jgi:ATP phosphoribosyltransferase
MKNSMKLADAACSAEQVFLPNRYQQPFIDAYQSLTGNEVPEMKERKMSAKSGDIQFRWSRGRDIPQIVELASDADPSLLTVGLTGSEWCREFESAQPDTSVVWGRMSEKRLGRVSLIASANSDIDLIRKGLEGGSEPIGVVTAYPNLIRALRTSGQYNLIPAVPVSGCAEGVADTLGMAAVDLVSKGETIAANGFVVVEELLDSYPALVSVPKISPVSLSTAGTQRPTIRPDLATYFEELNTRLGPEWQDEMFF